MTAIPYLFKMLDEAFPYQKIREPAWWTALEDIPVAAVPEDDPTDTDLNRALNRAVMADYVRLHAPAAVVSEPAEAAPLPPSEWVRLEALPTTSGWLNGQEAPPPPGFIQATTEGK